MVRNWPFFIDRDAICLAVLAVRVTDPNFRLSLLDPADVAGVVTVCLTSALSLVC